jgi:alkylation response protein AidB-like acyl-CoA dehydrogenase
MSGRTQTSTTDERDQFRHAVRAAIQGVFPLRQAQSLAEQAQSLAEQAAPGTEELWRALASLGCPGLLIPQEFGGAGATLPDMIVAVEECGRALAPDTLMVSGLLATSVLSAPGSRTGPSRLLALSAGTRRACVVEGLRVEPEGSGFAVSGTVTAVAGAADADSFVVISTKPDVVLVLDRGPAGAQISPRCGFDPTRQYGDVTVEHALVTQDELVAEGTQARRLAERARLHQCLGLAADSVGGAGAVLGLAIEQAKVREQFGRPIGSFQGVMYPIVDAHVATEIAKVITYDAAEALEADDRDAAMLVSAAKASACQAYLQASATAVQTFGGLGFTREVPAHLFLKRAAINERTCGAQRVHYARIGELLSTQGQLDW